MPTLPQEAVLLRRAREARGFRSPEVAAERVTLITISGTYWRKIEKGRYAPDPTLAHMSYVVGITPEQLIEVGRPEAAEILRLIPSRGSADAMIEELKMERPDFAQAWDRLPIDRQRRALERAGELRSRVDQHERQTRDDLVSFVAALATPSTPSTDTAT